MTQIQPKRPAKRGRIFPELTMSPEELAQEEAEKEAFYQRCLPIFERLRPQFIKEHYNWFLAIEPDSEDYFLDKDSKAVLEKALQKHPNAEFFIFGINETGVSGRI